MNNVASQSDKVEETQVLSTMEALKLALGVHSKPDESSLLLKQKLSQAREEKYRLTNEWISKIANQIAEKFDKFEDWEKRDLIDLVVLNSNHLIHDLYCDNPELDAFELKYNVGGIATSAIIRWLNIALMGVECCQDTLHLDHTELFRNGFSKIMEVTLNHPNPTAETYRVSCNFLQPSIYAPKGVSPEDEKEIFELCGAVSEAVGLVVRKMVSIRN